VKLCMKETNLFLFNPNFSNVFDHGNLSGFQDYILTSPRNKYSIIISLENAYPKKP